MRPIWKDYYVTIANTAPASGVQWRILQGSTVIYSGRAYAAPGEMQVKVKLNDILADYLTSTWEAHTLYGTFITQAYESGSWVTKDTSTFTPDWSYDYGYDPAVDGCNFPAQRVVVAGQYLPLSFVGGIGSVEITSATGPGDFNLDFNSDFLLMDEASIITTLTGDANGHGHLVTIPSSAVSVEAQGVTFRVLKPCDGRYVIYYVNAYGYIDYLVVRGKTDTEDALTRYTYNRAYNNYLPLKRGKWNYANEIVRKMTFHTEPMAEAQSLLMHHLLNSPMVYLHDLAKSRVVPLCLTGKTTEHKSGPKLYQYTIEAEIAQEMQRR